jgi:hypothetical protein
VQQQDLQPSKYATLSMPATPAAKWISAIIMLLIGVVGLATNFGVLKPEMLNQLWRAWPVIPLVYGLALLFQTGSKAPEAASGEK